MLNVQKNSAILSPFAKAIFEDIIERLDLEVHSEWYKYKKAHLKEHKVVPFQIFAKWIETRVVEAKKKVRLRLSPPEA